jgi:hypothetical protein
MDRVLPKSLRARLKKPFGKLYPSIGEAAAILEKQTITAVGDKVTEILITRNISPWVCIYDGKTKREEIAIPEAVKAFPARLVPVKNPAGEITDDAFQALKDAYASKEKTKIFVAGEEDLLTLAAINLAPVGTYVIYGQPDKGLVAVEVNAKTKKKVEKILAEMIQK